MLAILVGVASKGFAVVDQQEAVGYERSREGNVSNLTPQPSPMEPPLPSLRSDFVLGDGTAARGATAPLRYHDGHNDAEDDENGELELALWDEQPSIEPSPSPNVDATFPMALELHDIKSRYYIRESNDFLYQLKRAEADAKVDEQMSERLWVSLNGLVEQFEDLMAAYTFPAALELREIKRRCSNNLHDPKRAEAKAKVDEEARADYSETYPLQPSPDSYFLLSELGYVGPAHHDGHDDVDDDENGELALFKNLLGEANHAITDSTWHIS